MVDRRHERIDVPGRMRGEVMTFQPMTVNQISQSGIRINTPFALHLDSIHELRLSLGSLSIVLKGRIVYSRISRVEDRGVTYESGIEFVDLSDHAETAIAGFVQELKSRAEP